MPKILTPRIDFSKVKKYIPSNRAKYLALAQASAEEITVLDTNENPLGCSLKVRHMLRSLPLNRYPDGSGKALREAIAMHNDLISDNIVCGSGSGELLKMLISTYVDVGDEVVYPEYGFILYKTATLGAGAVPVKVKEVEYTVHVKNVLDAITEKTRAICIANPANPTGTLITRKDMLYLIDCVPKNILIIIDSAYAEYVSDNDYDSGEDFVCKYPNVVVTRTFSKIYGLAGIRVGWAYCPPAIADVLNNARPPFSVSYAAQNIGVEALKDRAFVENSLRHNAEWREFLIRKIRQLGLVVKDSHTNFILVWFKNEASAEKVFESLRASNIFVRAVKDYNLASCLRITVGTREENIRLVEALHRIL